MSMTPTQVQERLESMAVHMHDRIVDLAVVDVAAFTDYCNEVAGPKGILSDANIRVLVRAWINPETRNTATGRLLLSI